MPDFHDPTIGLPADESVPRSPSTGDLWAARGLNLFGLVSPVANLGMVQWSPKELRWIGVGAGVVAALAIGWGEFTHRPAVQWAAGGLHYALVLLGLIHPRLPEYPARLWIGFGRLLGKVMGVPIFVLLYLLAVTPTALVVRMFGRDPLERNAPPKDSYWIDREPVSVERYERQF
jgi:hypothetical protein